MKNKNTGKKVAATLVVVIASIVICIYLIIPFWGVLKYKPGGLEQIFTILPPLFGMIIILSLFFLLLKRFKELDDGNEDDLDKY